MVNKKVQKFTLWIPPLWALCSPLAYNFLLTMRSVLFNSIHLILGILSPGSARLNVNLLHEFGKQFHIKTNTGWSCINL